MGGKQQNETILPMSSADEGWVYLARVNGNGTQWKSTSVITEDYSPKNVIGQEVTLTRSVFLHNGPEKHNVKSDSPGWRANQPVIKVLHGGTRIKVVNTEINKALGGGKSLWALIDVLD